MPNRYLCVGINDYHGSDANLAGCVNDAYDWEKFCVSQDMVGAKLCERAATKANIVAGLRDMLGSLKSYEIGVFTFSGHGTWLPDLNGDEADGRDEALVPYGPFEADALIVDDELAKIFADRPAHTSVVFISDSCHSGTVYRYADIGGHSQRRVRFLPPGMLNNVKLGRFHEGVAPPPRRRNREAPTPGVICFSGCADHEYSADAWFDGRANGAMTYYLLQSLRGMPLGYSYTELYSRLRRRLPNIDFPQTPQFSATPEDRILPGFAVSG